MSQRVEVRGKFLRDAASLHIAGSLAQVSQLGSAVLLAFLLGSTGQGLFVSAIALHALGHCLISVGVPQVTASQIAANAAQGRFEKVAGWVAFLAKVNLLFALWMIAAGYFAFPWLAQRFLHNEEIGVWAWWLCFGPLLELPRDVARTALQGTRRMRALGNVENGHELVRFFLVVLGALSAGNARGAILGSLCASALGSAIGIAIYRSARADGGTPLPRVRDVMSSLREIPIRKGLRQGVRISIFKSMHTLFFMVMPRLILQSLVGSSSVAYYHIAQRLMSLPQVLSNAIGRTALPAMGELAGKRDGLRFRKLFAKVTLASGGLISAAIWIGLLFVPWVLAWIFPADYREPVMRFAVILAIGETAAAFCVGLESFFITVNRLRALFVFALVGLAIALPPALWLVTAIEVTGVAWAVVVLRGYNLLQLGYAAVFLWGRGGRADYWESMRDGPDASTLQSR